MLNLNFNTNQTSVELEPSKIFRNLNREKYSYPRDIQNEIWKIWFTKREKKDLIIKMNTGSGKTIVGLIILKSCLNEKKGPAVYVCPNKQLSEQVIRTAKELEINITEDPRSNEFITGKSILITNIFKIWGS